MKFTDRLIGVLALPLLPVLYALGWLSGVLCARHRRRLGY